MQQFVNTEGEARAIIGIFNFQTLLGKVWKLKRTAQIFSNRICYFIQIYFYELCFFYF